MQTSPVQKQFLHAFASFWRTDPGPYLLAALRRSACQDSSAVRGWTKGGCLVAAWGIQHYLADALAAVGADLHVSLVAVATDETEAAHVLVAIRKDGQERYLDAKGVWTREVLLHRLAQQYQYDVWSLIPWEAVALDKVRIPFDAQIAQAVSVALAQTLGPFSLHSIFPVVA